MLHLRQLEIFRAVMLSGSLTGAGARLQMSQPAVSKAVRRMEDQLGFLLFRRGQGRVKPTEEAVKLIREVDKVFQTLGLVERYAQDLKGAHSGVLSIASTPTMSCGFLPAAIAAFQKQRPKVHIWFNTAKTSEAIEMAASGQVDIGLVYAPSDHPEVAIERLFDTELGCVMLPDHPLSNKERIMLDDLDGSSVISNVRNESLYDLIGRMLTEPDLEKRITMRCNNTITACSLVRAGCGVALVEPMGIKELFPELVWRPLSPAVPIHPRAVFNKSRKLSRVAAIFLETLKASVVSDFEARSTNRNPLSV